MNAQLKNADFIHDVVMLMRIEGNDNSYIVETMKIFYPYLAEAIDDDVIAEIRLNFDSCLQLFAQDYNLNY